MTLALSDRLGLGIKKDRRALAPGSNVRQCPKKHTRPWEKPADLLLNAVGWIVLIFCGLLFGSVIGALSGWYVGTVYTEQCEPAYFSDFSDLSEIVHWIELPRRFAQGGTIAGALIGALVVVIATRLLAKRYQKADPK